jgi:hypothetical protein
MKQSMRKASVARQILPISRRGRGSKKYHPQMTTDHGFDAVGEHSEPEEISILDLSYGNLC